MRFRSKFVLALGAAIVTTLAGCAMIGGGSNGRTYTSVHGLMHDMDKAHMLAMSKELGLSRKGTDQLVLYSSILTREDIRTDDGQFLAHARTLEAATLQLQAAIKARDYERIGNSQALVVKSCSDCHGDYRK